MLRAPVCVLVLAALARAADLPAFPGAEGFGATTPGGRGGKVVFVHNLNGSGPGSLRAACEAKGPRIVLFRVSGVIELEKPIEIKEPFLTIAGQSAPGDGICLTRRGIEVDTHDVVIRHLRVRPGDVAAREVDAISIGGSSRNVVIDHCSASWATDEILSPSGAIADVTVQWCIISEGLNRSTHHKGAHGYGSLARAAGGVTLHHNLWAHNQNRNPRLGDNYGKPPYPTFDVRNNLMYNFRHLSIIGDTLSANYVHNYALPGPDTDSKGRLSPTGKGKLTFFVAGNVWPRRAEWSTKPASMFANADRVTFLDRPLETPNVRTQSAAEAMRLVLAGAGATLPARDAVDRRIVSEALSRSGGLIDSQWEVGGWPVYRSARPPRDSDHDGMPDQWESARGLNSRDGSDAGGDRDNDGYTNIEEYLNSIAAPVREKKQ